MSNIKILSAVLSFLLLFAISCSNEGTTGGNGDEVRGYTHSNHPPAGEYKYYNHTTHSSPNEIATVKIVGGNCNITGKADAVFESGSIEYDITVTNWYTFTAVPHLNTAGTLGGVYGEATVTTKPNTSLEYYNVDYNPTNESISVSLKTADGISYSALNLTRN